MREVSEKKSGGACPLYGASWLLKLSTGGCHAVIVTAAGGVGDAREAQIRDKGGGLVVSEGGGGSGDITSGGQVCHRTTFRT